MSRKTTAIITGVAGGIGESLAKAFLADGWRVVGVDRELSPLLPDESFVKADLATVAGAGALTAITTEIRHKAGDAPIKLLVNNAAVQNLGALSELSVEEITQTFNVNVIAPLLLSKAFLPDLKSQKGLILNIGSVHARTTKPRFAAYATSKAAIHGMTRALCVELGPDVRVLTLAPAAVKTEMLKAGFEDNPEGMAQLEDCHPAGRIAEPQEIAEIAVFLASDKAGFLTGATLYADGGVLSRLHDPD
ncbi:SDR family NAD(P)-dependent oxidoreductase [Hyphococcus sp.]|uniref:SDR family NAD(P)-dependent oxidoreductase n=1 Tax=Hyphococcus sp. TaxID=2038636 RepID=UPI003CCBC17F